MKKYVYCLLLFQWDRFIRLLCTESLSTLSQAQIYLILSENAEQGRIHFLVFAVYLAFQQCHSSLKLHWIIRSLHWLKFNMLGCRSALSFSGNSTIWKLGVRNKSYASSTNITLISNACISNKHLLLTLSHWTCFICASCWLSQSFGLSRMICYHLVTKNRNPNQIWTGDL